MTHDTPFLAPLVQLFCAGDLNGMRAQLLHSTAWIQHGRTNYGDEQIAANWLHWLSRCGLGECTEALSLQNRNEALHVLTLQPAQSSSPVRLALWSWHNREFVRRMVCIPDTELMARGLGLHLEQLAGELPAADPLVISDYDQQQHPFSVNVSPTDLADIPPGLSAALRDWWSLWQDQQLAAITTAYTKGAQVRLPGEAESHPAGAMVAFCGKWFNAMRRRYCQPESVLLDADNPDQIGLLWHMEGDMELFKSTGKNPFRRVRVTFISLLEFSAGQIVRDTLLVDGAALVKRLSC